MLNPQRWTRRISTVESTDMRLQGVFIPSPSQCTWNLKRAINSILICQFKLTIQPSCTPKYQNSHLLTKLSVKLKDLKRTWFSGWPLEWIAFALHFTRLYVCTVWILPWHHLKALPLANLKSLQVTLDFTKIDMFPSKVIFVPYEEFPDLVLSSHKNMNALLDSRTREREYSYLGFWIAPSF